MNWTRAILTAAIGLVSTILGAYFIWLGIELNDIGKKVERMDVNVERLLREEVNDTQAEGVT